MGGTLSGSLELSAAPGHLLSEPVLRTLAEAEDQSELHLLTTATAVREALVALHGERADAHLAQAAALAKHVGPGPLLLSEDQRKGRVLFRMPDPGARGFVRSVDALHHDLQRRLGPLDVQVKPTGTALLAYRGVLQTSSDLLRSLAIAVVVIGLIVGAVLRSIRGVMLTIIATTIPLLVAWGFLGAFDWRLQAGLAMVFTLGLGLAVDDTVHLLVRYREEQDSGPGALQRALRGTGAALVLTTLALVGTFGVSAMSSLPGISEVGVLAVVVLIAALVATLTLIPAGLAPDPNGAD
jgi:hypothetical protein